MSEIKQLLLAKKKELEEKIKLFLIMQKELDEVNKALDALNTSKKEECDGWGCPVCAICRRGPFYR